VTLTVQEQKEFLKRGFSRRSFGRLATVIAAGSTLPFYNESAMAQLSKVDNVPSDAVMINSNENPLGPCKEALEAVHKIAANGGRYLYGETDKVQKLLSEQEGVKLDYVRIYPGSSAPLHQAVLAFTSPDKALVMADPGYEAGERAARYIGSKVTKVPLTKEYAHDVKAMLAAGPNAGLFYICNPNNPTGTLTSKADIEWLVANKPAGSIVLIDEAYIHWSDAYPNNTASHLAAAGKDVIVLRTFSKIFGMAGARMGYFMARPDIVKKMQMYDGGTLSGQLPMPSLVCATTSLTAQDEIAKRRKELMATRAMTIDFLTKRNLKLIGPSQTNFVMIDWKTRTAKEMQAAFRAQDVEIAGGRWPIWPTVSRISIGSRQDMEGFFNAFNKVVSA
jgi:histidinol-phosphate aminotransferase